MNGVGIGTEDNALVVWDANGDCHRLSPGPVDRQHFQLPVLVSLRPLRIL